MPVDLSTKNDGEEEDLILKDFEKLKENRFLYKHLTIFISIITFIGILSIFCPPFYSIVPVLETD